MTSIAFPMKQSIGLYCDYFGEDWPCKNRIALYNTPLYNMIIKGLLHFIFEYISQVVDAKSMHVLSFQEDSVTRCMIPSILLQIISKGKGARKM